MRKLVSFLFALTVVLSCEEPTEITESMVINETATVTIQQTNGTAVNFNDSIEGDLNQVVSNFNSISDITIDSLSYVFANLTGNENASIVSAVIEINGIIVADVSDINIAQEIEKIAPELVITAEDEIGTKSVAYGNTVGYLIEAIKELKSDLDNHKKHCTCGGN